MKERFIQRYKDKIKEYLCYHGTGEGHRAIMYVMDEYGKILEEEFGIAHEEVREIYDRLYNEHYFSKRRFE